MWHKSSTILNFLRINFYEKSAVAISSIVVYLLRIKVFEVVLTQNAATLRIYFTK